MVTLTRNIRASPENKFDCDYLFRFTASGVSPPFSKTQRHWFFKPCNLLGVYHDEFDSSDNEWKAYFEPFKLESNFWEFVTLTWICSFVFLQASVFHMEILGRFMTNSVAFHIPSGLVKLKGVLRGYCPLQFYCKPLEFVALSTGQSRAYAAGFTGIYRRPTTNYERLTLISVRASFGIIF